MVFVANLEVVVLWIFSVSLNRGWLCLVLNNCAIIDSLNDVVCHCLHSIMLLLCILVERLLERLLVQLVFLREIVSVELEEDILLFANEILNILNEVLFMLWHSSIIMLSLVCFQLRHEGNHFTLLHQICELFSREVSKTLSREFLVDL